MFADNALQTCLKHKSPLTAITLETSFIFWLFFRLDFCLLDNFLTKLLCRLLEVLQRIRSPVSTAQWTCYFLSHWDFVFDPDFNTVNMYISSTAGLAVCKIFWLFHLLMTDTAYLFRFQLHSCDSFLLPFLRFFFFLFFSSCVSAGRCRKPSLYNLGYLWV